MQNLISSLISFLSFPPFPHLHHQHDSVERNHGQDGVLERRRHNEMPQTVLERVPILRHVSGQGLGADGKVYACPLKYRENQLKHGSKHKESAVP